MPPVFAGGVLAAMRKTIELRAGTTSEVWTLGGSYPSPTIRLARGDLFRVELQNQLGEPTNIHWHGLSVPPDMDGHPRDHVLPGETRTYTFPINQRAGTYWYHPHPHGATAKQVYLGMAGFFIVEDEEEQALDLPRGDHDVPLLVQDRRFIAGALTYEPTPSDVANGYLGETIFVNGVPNPHLEVDTALYRFRLLNGSNGRTFKVVLGDGRAMQVIASDGGLLERPIETRELWLGPGERAEVLIDFSNDPIETSISLMSDSFMVGTGGPGHGGGHGGGAGVVRQGARLQLLRFDVRRLSTARVSVPTVLSQVERIDPALAVRTRPFEVAARHMAAAGIHVINGKVFDVARVDEQVPFGDIEVWRIQSMDGASVHPMHVHGAQFQVVSRSGAPLATDDGWKDTVLLFPMETIELAVRFSDHRGLYLFHCHTLEHEDDGMMLNFEIV